MEDSHVDALVLPGYCSDLDHDSCQSQKNPRRSKTTRSLPVVVRATSELPLTADTETLRRKQGRAWQSVSKLEEERLRTTHRPVHDMFALHAERNTMTGSSTFPKRTSTGLRVERPLGVRWTLLGAAGAEIDLSRRQSEVYEMIRRSAGLETDEIVGLSVQIDVTFRTWSVPYETGVLSSNPARLTWPWATSDPLYKRGYSFCSFSA